MRAIALLLAAALTACGGGSEPELPTHPQFAYLTTCRDSVGPFWCEKNDPNANYSAPETGEWVRMVWCGPVSGFPRDQVMALNGEYFAVGSGTKLESEFLCLTEIRKGFYVQSHTCKEGLCN